MLYAFTLGRNKALSIAEISRIFGEKNIESIVGENLLVETKKSVEQSTLDTIGGTTKVSQVIGREQVDNLETYLTDYIVSTCSNESKCTFAINMHPLSKNNEKILKKIVMGIKRGLKSHGFKPRFINKIANGKIHNIENIQSFKEILKKENSIEMNLIRDLEIPNTFLISQLTACQDIEKYSIRDYEKPNRNAENGMLPPKLSQILINLAAGQASNETRTIIDPFCGSGSLLLEALLMGFHVVGTDINPDIINDAKINTQWLLEKFKLPKTHDIRIFTHDATQRFPKAKSHAIYASEGYLGPPLSKLPQSDIAQSNLSQISELYEQFFKNLTHMHDEAIVAICIPNYIYPSKTLEPPNLFTKISTHGFTLLPLIPRNLTRKLGIDSSDTFLYHRQSQLVGRRIALFKKNAK